jgi:hypothetical protein
MRAHALSTAEIGHGQLGWVLTHEIRGRDGKRLVRKGAVLDEDALARMADAEPGDVHLLELSPTDVHEDEAGRRISHAAAGDGVFVRGPVLSRYNLIAERKGLLRVNAGLLREINRVDGVTVFSLLDRQPVLPGKIVAGVKVTPIAIPEANVSAVEQLRAQAPTAPLVVLPYAKKRVSVVATEGLNERTRARFRESVEKKMRWYGSDVDEVRFVDSNPRAVADAFRDFLDAGADIVFAAGGNTLDPLDPISVALSEVNAEMVHYGAPAHPGSMFWLARAGDVPIINLASCSMYSRATVADLILPLVMTGRRVTSDDIIELGYGGLLDREMAFRFPDYDAETSEEEDEGE